MREERFYYFAKLQVFNNLNDVFLIFELENFTVLPCRPSHLTRVF